MLCCEISSITNIINNYKCERCTGNNILIRGHIKTFICDCKPLSTWKCQECSYDNRLNQKCTMCDNHRYMIYCDTCTYYNNKSDDVCKMCFNLL